MPRIRRHISYVMPDRSEENEELQRRPVKRKRLEGDEVDNSSSDNEFDDVNREADAENSDFDAVIPEKKKKRANLMVCDEQKCQVSEAFLRASEAFRQASEAMRLVSETLLNAGTAESDAPEKSPIKKKKKKTRQTEDPEEPGDIRDISDENEDSVGDEKKPKKKKKEVPEVSVDLTDFSGTEEASMVSFVGDQKGTKKKKAKVPEMADDILDVSECSKTGSVGDGRREKKTKKNEKTSEADSDTFSTWHIPEYSPVENIIEEKENTKKKKKKRHPRKPKLKDVTEDSSAFNAEGAIEPVQSNTFRKTKKTFAIKVGRNMRAHTKKNASGKGRNSWKGASKNHGKIRSTFATNQSNVTKECPRLYQRSPALVATFNSLSRCMPIVAVRQNNCNPFRSFNEKTPDRIPLARKPTPSKIIKRPQPEVINLDEDEDSDIDDESNNTENCNVKNFQGKKGSSNLAKNNKLPQSKMINLDEDDESDITDDDENDENNNTENGNVKNIQGKKASSNMAKNNKMPQSKVFNLDEDEDYDIDDDENDEDDNTENDNVENIQSKKATSNLTKNNKKMPQSKVINPNEDEDDSDVEIIPVENTTANVVIVTLEGDDEDDDVEASLVHEEEDSPPLEERVLKKSPSSMPRLAAKKATVSGKTVAKTTTLPKLAAEGKKMVFACQYTGCDYKTPRKDHMKVHVDEKHLNLKGYACITCDYRTARKDNLECHMATKHGWTRDVANRSLPDLMELDEDRANCDFVCPKCPFTAPTKAELDRHVYEFHEKNKSLACEYEGCSHKTRRKSNLKQHVEVFHLKLKRFFCTECDYKAYYGYNLDHHMLAEHTVEKNFKCSLCPFQSSLVFNLRKHLRIIHGQKI